MAFADLLGNVFDVRDVIERFEALEGTEPEERDEEEQAEFHQIASFLEEVAGRGDDEQWRGDWYPIGFIADHYFTTYAQEFAEDIGAIDRNASWPNNHIDWDAAADDLKQDYSSVEVNGTTYWYR